MMEITDTEAAALLDELKAKTRQDGDIDRQMYAESEGISISAAGDRLIRFAKIGKLIDAGILWDSNKRQWVRCYRRKVV